MSDNFAGSTRQDGTKLGLMRSLHLVPGWRLDRLRVGVVIRSCLASFSWDILDTWPNRDSWYLSFCKRSGSTFRASRISQLDCGRPTPLNVWKVHWPLHICHFFAVCLVVDPGTLEDIFIGDVSFCLRRKNENFLLLSDLVSHVISSCCGWFVSIKVSINGWELLRLWRNKTAFPNQIKPCLVMREVFLVLRSNSAARQFYNRTITKPQNY